MARNAYRAAVSLETEGRTLLGLAVPFDTPALVQDIGMRGRYWEAFSAQSFDKTLRQNPEPRPLFWFHENAFGPAEPLGVSDFTISRAEPGPSGGVLYRAHLSRTRRADEILELVKDRAAEGASVHVRWVTSSKKQFAEGLAVYRTEVNLRDLSLAPTGTQQYPTARTLAIRAGVPDGMAFSDISEAVEDALEADLFPTTGEEPADAWLCIQDLSDSWVVYSLGGNVSEEMEGYWRREYSMAADNAVTLGEAEQVEIQYVPVPAARAAVETGTPRLSKIAEYRRRAGF
jgi:hypothetical protein